MLDDHGLYTPFSTAVAGLTAAPATATPAPRFNSVWAAVNHARFWQKVTLLQLRGQPVDRGALGAENGWPPAGDPTGSPGDEAAWQAAVKRCLEVRGELAEVTAALNDEALAAPLAPGWVAPWQLVQGMIAHNACERRTR